MKKIVRVTESDLHRIIRESVKSILKEAHGEPDVYETLVSSSVLDDAQAEEMASEYNLSPEEAAAEWFKETFEGDFEEGNAPKWREYVDDIPEIGAELYHDYGAGYYFLIKKDDEGEKKDMPGFEGTWDDLNSLTNPFNENRNINEDYPFSPDEDKIDKIWRMQRREKEMDDDWRDKQRAIRKKYPGKSREWYDANIDTFYEGRNI